MLMTIGSLFLAFMLQAAPPAAAGSVSGQVIDSATGKPVGRATVLLTQSRALPTELLTAAGSLAASRVEALVSSLGRQTVTTIVTNADGRFEFSGLEPGSYTIGAVRAGYAVVAEEGSQGVKGRISVAVATGAKVTDLKLRLTPEAVISGRVTDDEGDPLQGVSIRLMRPVFVNGQRQLQRLESLYDVSDDRGEYRIFDLAPGRYYVAATGANAGVGYDRVFPVLYPNVTDASAATMLDVKPGARLRDIDFALRRARRPKIRGRVIEAATGQPVAGVTVQINPMGAAFNSASVGTGQADKQGEWVIEAAWPGPYSVVASLSRGPQERLTARLKVDLPEAGLDGVQVALTPGAEVSGSVRLEGEQGKALFNPAQMRVSLLGQEYDAGNSLSSPDANGEFKMSTIRPAAYNISMMSLPESLYLKSVRLENQDVIDTGFEVDAAKSYRLDVVVGGDGAQLEGTVTAGDDKPAGGTTVLLAPADPAQRTAQRLYKKADTGHDGKFILKGIPPGNYRLYAWQEVEPGIWFETGFLAPFEMQATAVSLEAGDNKTIGLKVLSAVEDTPR